MVLVGVLRGHEVYRRLNPSQTLESSHWSAHGADDEHARWCSRSDRPGLTYGEVAGQVEEVLQAAARIVGPAAEAAAAVWVLGCGEEAVRHNRIRCPRLRSEDGVSGSPVEGRTGHPERTWCWLWHPGERDGGEVDSFGGMTRTEVRIYCPIDK